MDYKPLDLSAWCNSGDEILQWGEVGVGEHVWCGLPFLVGGAAQGHLVAFGVGGHAGAVEIPVGRSARWIVFAHVLLESELGDGGPVGVEVATFRFRLESGEEVVVPVRERFEIGRVGGAAKPFLAVPDRLDGLMPRQGGPWEQAGRRQTESVAAAPHLFYLWSWQNPHPADSVEAVVVEPRGPRFAVGAMTTSELEETPICREGSRRVVIEAPAASDGDLEVRVDRGFATYAHALPLASAEEFLEDGHSGWGEDKSAGPSPAYSSVVASPSATVSVASGEEELGSVRWGEVLEKGAAEDPGRLKIEVVEDGRSWVHTTVLDDETGKPVPCRVHFRSPRGIPYAPHGHHSEVNSNMGTWHLDVGGDVRLGQATYAYIDGTCQGWLPHGDVLVDVARGFEYEPLRARVQVRPGQRDLKLRLKRWCHMNRDGWYSGDSHVHFLSTQGSHTEAQGEDLNVVNLLPSQWGSLFTNTEEFTGRESVSPDGSSIVYVGSENRQHFLGHLILMGLKEPVMPWCSDGPGEAELGGTLEVTMSDWADQCHEQGGTVVIPHFPNPNGEPATLVATGRADAVEMLRHDSFNHLEYYRYLNCGYRLPLVGGTDKMSSDVPVGIYRTYVQLAEGEPFTYDNWCKGLTAGRTFHSGGPLIRLSVDGHGIGDVIALPGNGGRVEVEVEAESILPIHTLQLVQEGRVVASTDDAGGARRLQLCATVEVSRHSWLAARCGGPGYDQAVNHHDGWRRGIMAHTSPVYLAVGGDWWMFDQDAAQYMLTLVDGCLEYIRNTSRQHHDLPVDHHHGRPDHYEYLEAPFRQAREALHRRMHRLGVPH